MEAEQWTFGRAHEEAGAWGGGDTELRRRNEARFLRFSSESLALRAASSDRGLPRGQRKCLTLEGVSYSVESCAEAKIAGLPSKLRPRKPDTYNSLKEKGLTPEGVSYRARITARCEGVARGYRIQITASAPPPEPRRAFPHCQHCRSGSRALPFVRAAFRLAL